MYKNVILPSYCISLIKARIANQGFRGYQSFQGSTQSIAHISVAAAAEETDAGCMP
jgi:hypothetical protein